MLHLPHVLPRVWADTYRQGLVTLRKHTIVPDRLSSRDLWWPRCLCQCGKTPRMPRLQKAGRKPRKSSNFVNLARCVVRSDGNSWRTNMKAKSTEKTKIRMLHVQIELKEDKSYLTTGQRQHHVLEFFDWWPPENIDHLSRKCNEMVL